VDIDEALCAVLFNVQGYLHEYLKKVDTGEFIPMSSLTDITGRYEFYAHPDTIKDPYETGHHTHPTESCGWGVKYHHKTPLEHDLFRLHSHDGPVNELYYPVTYYLLPEDNGPVRKLDALCYDAGLGAYAEYVYKPPSAI
jgi:hypothetical protein